MTFVAYLRELDAASRTWTIRFLARDRHFDVRYRTDSCTA